MARILDIDGLKPPNILKTKIRKKSQKIIEQL